jgi:hypothetical protein
MASANSGSITGISPVGQQFSATFTTVSDQCGSPYYCGWFAYATQIGVGEACNPYDTAGKLVYVGALHDDPGTEAVPNTFYVNGVPFKLCLSVSYGSATKVSVAEAIYTPPVAVPSPTPVPAAATPVPTVVPQDEADGTVYVAMTIGEAKANVPALLKKEYKSKFSRGTLTRACLRASSRKVRCRVGWKKGAYKYSGVVMLWYGDDDAADDYSNYTYSFEIKRKRTKSTRSSSGGNAPTAQPSCNPNYSGACLPLTGDVDCGEISARDFSSTGSDPFQLDGDDDGIACES